jgi:hypothetical protein
MENPVALISKSLRGDLKIEAAAISDPAQILYNAQGEHVSKIQRAIMQLDSAEI